ncbi:BCAS2 family protein [Lineolata rhizophorae]|uniref:BCAS2 family protein n=1 Tax=Lineolata rhizophorae TaxID=578093 RepID=A0A6A6P4W5_9PEZI|nr:BCAS2 family protein [Lineolata rhizophorae]
MTLINESYDYLSYIDPTPPPTSLRTANDLVAAELSPDASSALHPSLPPSYEPRFSHLITTEHERLAAGQDKEPSTGIDLSRYEALEPPEMSTEDVGDAADKWKAVLRQSYVSATYLSERQRSLHLLEKFGKNMWLVGNAGLEAELKGLEEELAKTKKSVQDLEEQRRSTQERSAGELAALEDTWRKLVSRLVEVQFATLGLEREILERQKQASTS